MFMTYRTSLIKLLIWQHQRKSPSFVQNTSALIQSTTLATGGRTLILSVDRPYIQFIDMNC